MLLFNHSSITEKIRIPRSTKLITGSIIFFSLLSIAVLEPMINHYRLGGVNPLSIGTYRKLLPPSFEKPLGTDQWGRDLLAIVLIGLRNSLLIGVISGGFSTLIAVIVSLSGGWWKGTVDNILNYITNAVLVIPLFPIVIAISAYMRTGLVELCLLLAFFSWPWAARTLRAQILSLREQPYIDLARVTNFNGIEIIFEEIFPNLLPFVVNSLSFSVIGTIMGETGLRILGFGPPEVPSIGYLLNQALKYGAIASRKYSIIVPPIIILILIFISLNLINVGLDDVYNPKLRKVTGE